jgi:tetratricopeptide (TPR) repeat protein
MELVHGRPITSFCDERRLGIRERLELFVAVCQAVQHAHQKGIIHRDIKPSNILVTDNDGVPVPKVIDFGIAKATQGRLTDQTLFTAFEQFIGTPAYMSPEQAEMSSAEVDTRSDIYSLGVLLYELLTGQTPFSQKDLVASGLEGMRRTVREKEPARPSTRLSTMAQEELALVAKHRQSHPPQLIHLLRGDLDWIAMKCLQKDPARRYETANDLVMDVRRYLMHEPVLARPDSQAYRMGKFLRRHRASAVFATLILVALMGGLAGTLTQARRATKQAAVADRRREFALRQLARAEAINDLNTFLLSDAAPVGKSFTVGELLQRAERVVEHQAGDTDEDRVQLLIAIGYQYENQDQHGKARELLARAYDISRKVSEPSVRAEAAATLAVPVTLAGDEKRGEALIEEALRDLGDAPEYAMYRVFCLLRGSRVARESGREALGIERALEGQRLVREAREASPLLQLTVAMEVAEAYRMGGKYREAVTAFTDAYQRMASLGRDQTEKAGTLLNNWALAVDGLGLPLQAEGLYRRAVELSSAEGTNASTVSPMLLNNLARSLCELGRYAEAAQYAEQAFQKATAAGDEHVINMSLNVRATIYREQRDLAHAREMTAAFEAKTKQLLPAGHVAFAAVASQKSLNALAGGDAEGALVEANRAVELVEAKPEMRGRQVVMLLRRAKVLMGLRQYEAARADAARALAFEQEACGPDSHSCWAGRAQLAIAGAMSAQGKTSEARLAYASAWEHLRDSLGQEHAETQEAANGMSSP